MSYQTLSNELNASCAKKVREGADVVEHRPSEPLDELNALLKKRFHKPDLQAVRIVLGTAKSHYLNPINPVSLWLSVVAPEDVRKAMVAMLSGLPRAVRIDSVNENSFLSECSGDKCGILQETGKTSGGNGVYRVTGDAIFLVSDLALQNRTTLKQLKQIHDGRLERTTRTGTKYIWEGRVTIIAVVPQFEGTPARSLCVRTGDWGFRREGVTQGRLTEECREFFELSESVQRLFEASK